MTAISMQVLVDAIKRVEAMPLKARERLAGEVHDQQPNLLYSVLVLQRFGASLEQLEIVINLLLVFHEAMKGSGRTWPVITEETQERCLKRVTARARFIEGLTPEQQAQAVSDSIADCREVQLLAHVFAKFGEYGLLAIETEVVKMMMLCSLNLVECIGDTAASIPSKQ